MKIFEPILLIHAKRRFCSEEHLFLLLLWAAFPSRLTQLSVGLVVGCADWGW